MAAPLLKIEGLVKDYGANRVLDQVDLELWAGEIHALLGENGAGKSTLIKLVAGVVPVTSGSIEVQGSALPAGFGPADVSRAGLAFVHQDLGLVDDLTVAENIALPDRFERRLGLVSARRNERRARALLASIGVEVPPAAEVGDLPQDLKVMVAVARAFAMKAAAVVLDEVSASLPTPEFERFAENVRTSAAAGIGYLYVTHRLSEVFDLADRVTVLRDGKVIATAPVAETDHDQVVEWIVGGALPSRPPAPPATAASAASDGLVVDGLEGEGLAGRIGFRVAPGEILAICGLVGSGTRDIARLLGGAARPAAGSVRLGGRELSLGNPRALLRQGVAYLPGDRDREAAIGDLAVRENLFLTRRSAKLSGFRRLRGARRERVVADQVVERFRVRPPDCADRPLATLSGGNRQKVVLARALGNQPSLLVLEDPTQGVDVGSREEIYAILAEAAANGMSVVFSSSDFEEAAAEADRVLVVAQGAIVAELDREQADPERLTRISYESDGAEVWP
ncbi:MAG TPA: sugar ABC transporter ATP-binding protein [Solirubrobacterales bacterium]|jgi:ribose transport system ATP-binding protein